MKLRWTALALALALLTGCGGVRPVELPAGTRPEAVEAATSAEADRALSRFGAELLRAAEQPGENTLISPLSVALALAMTANGAAGDTLAAFEARFGADLETVNANCASLLADYAALGGSTRCQLAHSLWLDERMTAAADFLARCQGAYGAQVYQTDLDTEDARRQVNGWVEEHTGGMIRNILAQPPEEAAVMLLVNALYLKNTWETPFEPEGTREGVFRSADGVETRTEFLSNGIRTQRYFRTEDAAGVVLPYDDGRLGFVAVLPHGTLEEWLAELDGDTLPQLTGAAEETRLFLSMPKFECEWGGELAGVLAELGLGVAFDPGAADFTAMGSVPDGPLYIGSVIHRARIQVNEEGTEAAAATVVGMEAGSPAPAEYETLVLDRPFLYAIVDLERGVPLFLGTFEQV